MLNWSHAEVLPIPKPNPKNCHITITTTYKTGEAKTSIRHFKMKSKEKCEKMNRILSDNMNPEDIAKVETNMNWSGK